MRARHVTAIVLALLAVRAVLGLTLWSPGWSALCEDDFGRVALAQDWARKPFVLTSPLMVWLPLQAWVHGLALRLGGRLADDDPMLVVALVNSAAALATAAVLGRAAFVLFGSVVGGLVAFMAVLFAPYSVLTSLSGLSEPLYYLAVAIGIWGLIAWVQGGRPRALAWGALGVAAAGGIRYDAWLLAAAWAVVVPFSLPTRDVSSLPGLLRLWWTHRREVVLAVAPLAVPLLRLAVYAAHTGTTAGFVDLQGQGFVVAFGGNPFPNELSRWLFYPLALLRSAPVLISVLGVLALWCVRRHPAARPLVALLGLQLVVFLVLSAPSGGMGGYLPERYMFTYALGLTPLLGVVPSLWERVRPPGARLTVAGVAGALAVIAAARGIATPPDEWLPAADTVSLSLALGETARPRSQALRVALARSMDVERVIVAVMNGRRVEVGLVTQSGVDAAGQVPSGVDVWVERIPARIAAIPLEARRVVGRYHLYGPAAAAVPPAPRPLTNWTRRDESGTQTTIPPTRPLALEFTSDDPRPGQTAALERRLPRGPVSRDASIRLRAPYGHGFYRGRVTVDVRLDDRVILSQDLADRSHWRRLDFTIPSGDGESRLAVVVTATRAIESGWAWGRASTVFVDDAP